MTAKKSKLTTIIFLIGVVLLACFTDRVEKSNTRPVTMTLEHRDEARLVTMRAENVDKVLIFKWDYSFEKSESKAPLVTIDDEDGLALFANMINNAQPINGALDVAAPPYIAQVYCQSSVAELSLYIGRPEKGSSHGGMYINECHTERGYQITVKDATAFWDAYGGSLIHWF
jgi:hypothetical protein